MYNFAFALLAAAILSTAPALAAGTSTHTRTLNLKGTGQNDPSHAGADGQCNVGYANQCPSGNCECVKITVTSATGNLNKGSMKVSNFFVTGDHGLNPGTEPAVDGGPDPDCRPFFGVLTVTSASESKALNVVGTSCKHVTGVSSKQPRGNHDKDMLSGGWGISNNPAPSPDASGWGTLTGQVTNVKSATPTISVKLSGTVTE